MKQLLKALVVSLLLPLVFIAAALAAPDPRLVGSWSADADGDNLLIVFNADGTATLGSQGNTETATYTADFSKSPGLLILKFADGEIKSLIEFVDDNHIRITEPSEQPPATMDDGSPIVFERTP